MQADSIFQYQQEHLNAVIIKLQWDFALSGCSNDICSTSLLSFGVSVQCKDLKNKKKSHYITFQFALSRSDFIKPKPVRFKTEMFKLNIKKTSASKCT